MRNAPHAAPAAKAAAKAAPLWIAGTPAAPRPQGRPHPAATRVAAKPKPHRAAPASAATRKLAAAVAFTLCAKAGTVTIGGSPVPIWGFAQLGTAASCADAAVAPQLPGPELSVTAGDVVTLTVTNSLPGRTLTIEAPGVAFAPGPQDVASGATASLTFTASEGTYLYSSGGDGGRQTAMGLYGALVVHSGTAATEDGVAVDAQKVLLLSEVDPAFNASPDTFDFNNWHPSLWLINGQPYPTTPALGVTAGQRVLLRWLNAGIDNNTMSMLGVRQQLLRADGAALANPFEVVSHTFPSGSTADGLVTVPAAAAVGDRFPLYNRNLNAGMTTFLQVS
jgi:FtsP/CotA-like multicopper oxidase with cupredoxin domain